MRLMNVGETKMFYCVELGFFIRIYRSTKTTYAVAKLRLGDVKAHSLDFCHAFTMTNNAKLNLNGVIKAAIDHCVLPLVVNDDRGYEVIPIADSSSSISKNPWPLGRLTTTA